MPSQSKIRANLVKMIEEWRDLAAEMLEYLDPEHEDGGDYAKDQAVCRTCMGKTIYTHDGGMAGGYEQEIEHDDDCVYIKAHELLENDPRSMMGDTPPQVLRLATKKLRGWTGSRY